VLNPEIWVSVEILCIYRGSGQVWGCSDEIFHVIQV
jgi:alpha-amylase/alpha-mannosidase (GH57 family)